MDALRLQLQESVARDPEDRDAFIVYADWLQQQGDPHGELIAVQIERESKPRDAELWERERALLEELAPRLLGSLREVDGLRFSFRRGFLDVAKLGLRNEAIYGSLDLVDAFQRTIEAPAAGFLRRLELGGPNAVDGVPSYAALVGAMSQHGFPGTLQALSFHGAGAIGLDLVPLYPAIERVRELYVEARVADLGDIALSELRSIDLRIYEGADQVIASLRRARLPNLEHLAIRSREGADEIAAELATWSVLRQLRVLELGRIDDAGARRLIQIAPAFRHLERFVIDHEITSEDLAVELGHSCRANVEVIAGYPADDEAGAVDEVEKAGDFERGIEMMDALLERFPRCARYWSVRGELVEEIDEPRALADYTKAIDVDPRFVQAYYRRGTLRSDLGDYDGALDDYERALAIDDRHAATLNNRAIEWLRCGHYARAEADVRIALESDPSDAVVHCTLAEICAATGRLDEGLAALAHGAALSPEMDEFARTGESVEALRALPDFEAALRRARGEE